MNLFLNVDSQTLVHAVNDQLPITGIVFKRGDAAQLNLQFFSNGSALSALSSTHIIFGCKRVGDYDGSYVVSASASGVNGNPYYLIVPSFNTVPLNALLGSDGLSGNDVATVTLMGEIAWSYDSGATYQTSSNQFSVIVNNDIIKGGEGTPLENPSPITWLETAGPRFFELSGGAYIRNEGSNIGFVFDTLPLSGMNNIFLGVSAGYVAEAANYSNFIGTNTGIHATNANFANFIGYNAGSHATNSFYANFIGYNAGNNATSAGDSNFFGHNAGNGATLANNSNFIGDNAGNGAANAYFSNFVGHNAGNGGSNAYQSNFVGANAGNGTTTGHDNNFVGYSSGVNIVSGSSNIAIGSNAGASTASLSGLSACIILGDSAKATASNQLALGSATSPLSVIPGGSLTTSLSGLKVNINGHIFTIPLLA